MIKIYTLLFSLVMCFLFANSVFAVGFSQLVKIGDISTDPLSGFHFDGECKIVCVKSNCADLFYAPYWGKQLKGWISNGKT